MSGVRTPFGTTRAGDAVERVELSAGGLRASVLTYGAILQDVRFGGVPHSLTLGSDRLADYEGAMCWHGALIAPVANRLGAGRAWLQGREIVLERAAQENHLLHSGAAGTHARLWRIEDLAPDRVTLAVNLAHGEGGFPGRRNIRAEYSVTPTSLRLAVKARTDRPTLFNATNHSYWNLDGSESWTGHRLRIDAARMLAVTDDVVPTGEIREVTGATFDFRTDREIAPGDPALDSCFCLSDDRRPLRPVLRLRGRSGVTMEVATTEPGVQVYDGRDAIRPGRVGYEGLAIETQG
ncbi:aldose epimerase family protein [Defluviimonas salinarum]|nr:galactose mutarotase [Defluviimonas salinarum]